MNIHFTSPLINTDSVHFEKYKTSLTFSNIDSNNCMDSGYFLKIAEEYYNKSQYDSSLLILEQHYSDVEIQSNKPTNNSELKCYFLFLRGLNLYEKKNWYLSKNDLLETLKFGESILCDSVKVVSLKTLGNIHFNLREYSLALKVYQQALAILINYSKSTNILKSSLMQNIGISYSMLYQNDSALKYIKKSLLIKESYLEKHDIKIISGYVNISRLLQILGDLSESLKYIDKAEKLYIEGGFGEYSILGPIYYNKGSILLALNDYEQALQYHELAIQEYKQYYNDDNEIFSELYYNMGIIYFNLSNYKNASHYFISCLKNTNSLDQRIKANFQLGLLFLEIKNFSKAERYLMLSINLAESFGVDKNFSIALAYLNYGIYCEITGNTENALKYYLIASSAYKKIFGDKSRDLAYTYSIIGNYFLNLDYTNKALRYFQKALVAYLPSFNDSSYSINPDPTSLEADLNLYYAIAGKSRALYLKSKTDPDQKDLILCLETTVLSINLLEKIRNNLYGENTKLIIAERVNEIYNLATTVSLDLYRQTNELRYLDLSFQFSEKSKASILLSTIKENEAIMIGNIPNDTKELEKRLKKQINQYQNIIHEENQSLPVDTVKISRIRHNLFKLKISYDSLIVSLEEKYPEYYNLRYNNEVVTIQQVQKNLSHKNHALIEYKIVDSLLYTFIIKKDTAYINTSKINPLNLEDIKTFLKLMGNIPNVDSARSNSYKFAILGYKISELLQLTNSNLDDIYNLTIVPDGILGYLSFDALISKIPDPEKSSFRNLEYMIKKFTFSYGNSATLFFKNGNTKRKTNNRILAIAPKYDDIDSDVILQSHPGLRDLTSYLIPLPNAISEVQEVTSIMSGNAIIGKSATEKRFKEASSEYGILHFAMHTLINDDDPLSSKLIFTLDSDSSNDGFLNTYEIYNLDLNAQLAVLSACKTGTGKLSKGEGIMSLARGFLYAGVPGIIMTLWAVEDIASANIISDFYRNLKKGENKDLALRSAKLSYLNNANSLTAHPYFWAAYVQIGDNSPIQKSSINPILYSSIGILLIALILLYIRYNVKKMKK